MFSTSIQWWPSTACVVFNPKSFEGTGTDYITVSGSAVFFTLNRTDMSWFEAAALCQAEGAHLATIESMEEQIILDKHLPKEFLYWTAGVWNGRYDMTWISGTN